MPRARFAPFVLLVAALTPAVAQDAPDPPQGPDKDVAAWVEKLGTNREEFAFQAMNELVALGERAIPACRELLSDAKAPGPRRWQAAKVLGALKAQVALDDLLAVFADDPHRDVRSVSTEALGLIGDERALEPLKKRLETATETMERYTVETAIARIEGRPLPPYPDQPKAKTWPTGAGSAASWKQPPIETDTPASATLSWADTFEGALRSADESGRLVVATFVPVQDKRWLSGFAGAARLLRGQTAHPFGDARAMQIDAGLVKERALMAAVFSDPEVMALVTAHFVPARVRLYTFDFETPRGPLGTFGIGSSRMRGPCLAVFQPDGTLVHVTDRLGVLSPRLTARTLRASLESAGKQVGDLVLPKVNRAAVVASALAAGVRLEQWETPGDVGIDALANTTEVGADSLFLDDVVARATEVLIGLQADDGGWPDPHIDSHPTAGAGSRWDKTVARSGLAVSALLRAAEIDAGLARRALPAARRGIERIGSFSDAPPDHIWQLTYALEAQVTVLTSPLTTDTEKKTARARSRRLVRALEKIQKNGGWSYMLPPRIHSFNTAPVLLLLTELDAIGVGDAEVRTAMRKKAAQFLESVRSPDEARLFEYAPTMPFPLKASSCRTALCELALQAHTAKPDHERLRDAVDLFLEHEAAVRTTTKVFESYFSVRVLHDAYHHYFGHWYTARAIAALPKEQSAELAEKQIELILAQVEADGSFVDAQMQGKGASTAMAMLALLEARALLE